MDMFSCNVWEQNRKRWFLIAKLIPDTMGGMEEMFAEGAQTSCVSQRSLLAWVQARYANINYGHVQLYFSTKVFVDTLPCFSSA